MSNRPAESVETELAVVAREFFGSRYAEEHFSVWPIDRRLDAYLRRRQLTTMADDPTAFVALLDLVTPTSR